MAHPIVIYSAQEIRLLKYTKDSNGETEHRYGCQTLYFFLSLSLPKISNTGSKGRVMCVELSVWGMLLLFNVTMDTIVL